MNEPAQGSAQPQQASGYVAEYMAACGRTESLGLKAPLRVVVRKPCVDVDQTLPALLDYFNAHTPEELLGQTLAINIALIPLLYEASGVPFEITLGWIELAGNPTWQHGEERIRQLMTERLAAWQREGVPFQIWLTSPACEILDVTFGMNNGWASTRDECAQLIIYKTPEQMVDEPIYHPTVVGEDFLRQKGICMSWRQAK